MSHNNQQSQQLKSQTDRTKQQIVNETNTRYNFYEEMQSQIISDEIQHDLSTEQNHINYGSMITLTKNGLIVTILHNADFMFIPTLILSSWFLIYCLQTFHTKLNFGTLSLIICSIFAAFFIISYFLVGISNPGIASTNKLPTLQQRFDHRYCRDCRVLRVNKTRHCQFCNVCILQMDHHCIWVGKCIGKNNLTHFKVFIFSALMTLVVFSVCIFLSSENKPLKIT